MNNSLGKAGIILLLGATVAGLSGCLMGDSVDSEAVASNPPPPSSNNPPSISGNPPPAVTVGQMYSFTPTASDPDGDPLTFSIQNRPNWASFDTATGELSGMAGLGTAGDYANIVISVSDGQASSSLGSFDVEVTQASLGSATLTWQPPTANSDGTPLMDLDAYKIYYGVSATTLPNEIIINNTGLTSFVVENLTPNTYYFSATAINTAGVESGRSNLAVITVN